MRTSSMARIYFVAVLIFLSAPGHALLIGSQVFAHENSDLRVYAYISPPAKKMLKKFGMTESKLESYTRDELLFRSIRAINNGQLLEGEKDAFRIDVRRKKTKILLELSIRQGGSIHNMLERWSDRRLIPTDNKITAKEFQDSIFGSISALLDSLKSKYDTPAYKTGHMIPEDFRPEQDE